jgi:hypothetical protein
MLSILKDHVDGLIFEDDLSEGYDILVVDLPVQLERIY